MSSFLDSTGLTNLLGKIKSAFVAKADTTAATTVSIDSTPTQDSSNLVTSGGVYTALGGKQDTIDSSHKLSADLISDGTTNKTVTQTEKTTWNNKGTYSKPSGGIPKTDLASAVQTSLGKADTALQSFTETDPVFSASDAAGITSSDIENWDGKLDASATAKKTASIAYGVVDSSSTSTAFTATVPGITTLEDGTCVMLRNSVVTSASEFTLNVNGLGAHHAFNNMTLATAETTIFNINYTMLFVYCADVTVSNIKGAWCCYRGYDANTNTIGYQLRTNSSVRTVTDTARYYKLYFTSADTQQWVPASVNSTNNVTTARTPNQRPINPFGPIVYTSANTNYATGANLDATTIWQQYAMNLGYSFGPLATSMTSNKPAYLKCAPQSDGSAIIDSTTPVVQALPSTEDGKIYIFLGIAYTDTNIELNLAHPVYYYKDNAIRLWTNTPVPSNVGYQSISDINDDIENGVTNSSVSIGDSSIAGTLTFYNNTDEEDYGVTLGNDQGMISINSYDLNIYSSNEIIIATEVNAEMMNSASAMYLNSYGITFCNMDSPHITISYYDSNEETIKSDYLATLSEIPTKVSDLNNDSGFTTNTGTITGITMNGVSKGTSGVVDLGTVLTAHQDISGKESTSNKVTSLSSSSTDTQYPSAKCVYDMIGDIQSALTEILGV